MLSRMLEREERGECRFCMQEKVARKKMLCDDMIFKNEAGGENL